MKSVDEGDEIVNKFLADEKVKKRPAKQHFPMINLIRQVLRIANA